MVESAPPPSIAFTEDRLPAASHLLLIRSCYVFFSSRRRHTRLQGDWSSDVCSSDLGVDVGELLPRAEENGVTFVPGTDFGSEPNTLRLAFSFVSPGEIVEGVSRLAAAQIGRASCRERV